MDPVPPPVDAVPPPSSIDKETLAPPPAVPTAAQLAFDLSQKSALFAEPPAKREALQPGGDDLEIIVPVVPPPVTSPEDAMAYKPPVVAVQEDNPNLSEPYDPTLELSHYEFPHTQLLVEYPDQTLEIDREELETNKNLIIQTLFNFKIEIIILKRFNILNAGLLMIAPALV
jgi:S-DNA-T family DNA segregation ATPase FtsK/SpoIIIE